jgi:gliding motility-associated protein GldM
MAGYKETPRQKMIAMMYLVLTALLALNVSKEMLNAFLVVNESVELTNENFTKKLNDTYQAFEKKYQNDQVKVKPFYDRALEARQLSTKMVDFVDSLKFELIALTEKVPYDTAKIISPYDIRNKDDYDTPTNFFFKGSEDGSKGAGKDLKQRIDDFRMDMLNLVDADDRGRIKLGLRTDGEYKDAEGVSQNWIQYNFYHTILAADIAILNKIITEVYNAEFDIVNFLLDAVDAKDFKYDEIDAKILPKRDYVFVGEEYQAEAIVAAYSTTQNPEVFLKMGVDSLPISELASAQTVEGERGMVRFSLPATTEGVQKYAGVIRVKGGTGEMNNYFFNEEYTVGRPSLTVSATKMNVFYIGVDNPVDISSPGIPNEKLTPSISVGTLTRDPENDSWVVRVKEKPQGDMTATISVLAEIDGETKKMGEMKFRLRTVPDPTAKIANKTEGTITTNTLLYSPQIVPVKPKDFDFDMVFEIVSFDMVLLQGESVIKRSTNGPYFSQEMKDLLETARRGQRIWFENIVATGSDNETRRLNSINFVIQ